MRTVNDLRPDLPADEDQDPGQSHASRTPTGKEARDVYKLDEHYSSAEETLAKIGFPPGRKPGQLGFTFHA